MSSRVLISDLAGTYSPNMAGACSQFGRCTFQIRQVHIRNSAGAHSQFGKCTFWIRQAHMINSAGPHSQFRRRDSRLSLARLGSAQLRVRLSSALGSARLPARLGYWLGSALGLAQLSAWLSSRLGSALGSFRCVLLDSQLLVLYCRLKGRYLMDAGHVHFRLETGKHLLFRLVCILLLFADVTFAAALSFPVPRLCQYEQQQNEQLPAPYAASASVDALQWCCDAMCTQQLHHS
jgi:hypothetical protein